MLEAEELGDSAGEVGFDFGEGAVGIDDAPDRLDETEALVAREVLAEELREVEEVHALAALLLGEAEDLLQFVPGNMHFVPDVARDALPLLGDEDVVRVRDLEQQRAGRDGHGIGTRGLGVVSSARGAKNARIASMPIDASLAREQVSGKRGQVI